jgi:hypothetical protein
MSKIVREYPSKNFRAVKTTIVQADNGQLYYVDTAYTYDHGLETMAFLWSEKDDKVVNWSEVAADRYSCLSDALAGHSEMCEHLEEYMYGFWDDDYDDEEEEEEES